MTAALGGLSSQELWYVSRGSGLVLLVVLNLVIVLGSAVRAGWSPGATPRFVVEGLHKNLSLLACALLVVHVLTAVTDPYVTIGWAALVVPFSSPYRTLWIGLGTLSLDLLAAVVLSSLVRSHLGRRTWRLVHLCVYLSWPLAIVHSIEAGNDMGIAWVSAIIWASTAAAALAVLVSLSGRGAMSARRGAGRAAEAPSPPRRVGAAR